MYRRRDSARPTTVLQPRRCGGAVFYTMGQVRRFV